MTSWRLHLQLMMRAWAWERQVKILTYFIHYLEIIVMNWQPPRFREQRKSLLPKKKGKWLMQMVEVRHGLSTTALKMKMSEITMTKATPFRNGILGGDWMWGWQKKHPKLSLRTAWALETTRIKGLYKKNIQSFYENMDKLYILQDILPIRCGIWMKLVAK